jgi:hypothetical protein
MLIEAYPNPNDSPAKVPLVALFVFTFAGTQSPLFFEADES